MPVPARCPDCGAPFDDRDACDRAFHELGARAASDVAFAYRRRAVVDAYCLQHPAYIRSIKSLAAHLCGLCAAMERASDPRAERAIWSALRLPPGASKPTLDLQPWTLTVAVVHGAPAQGFRAAVDAWVADVWMAWNSHHDLAREWLDYSIAHLSARH